MMQIKIVCFGSLDQQYYAAAFQDYAKRIRNYANLEVIELQENFHKETSANKKLNSQILLTKLTKYADYQIVCLDIQAPKITSEAFSQLLADNKNLHRGKILFVIGPSDGFSNDLFQRAFIQCSFGNITLPHQLCRVILVEQIYRGFKIINNEKYHK